MPEPFFPAQGDPSGAGETVHREPPAQVSFVHGLPSSQLKHTVPPAPHFVVEVPGWHVAPSQQPEQQVPE
jgi:hypothetical protein